MLEKRNVWLPVVLMIVFAITRWPWESGGERLLPLNFSAAYALVFCAGVYFRNRLGWWLPLGIMVVTDLVLNFFYYRPKGWGGFQIYQLMNYTAYAAMFWLGRRFKPDTGVFQLIFGGVLGGVFFYLITNTAAWLFNPFENKEYQHDWQSWLAALTTGTSQWPGTWLFFRNTLLSSGLFTALFAAAMKVSERMESAAEKKAANASAESEVTDAEPQPEESKA
jgi:hypothetical protein